jgi:spermidine synthase
MKTRAGASSARFGVPAAAVLLATGAAGLICEVAWQRHLGVIVGVDHAATATTLAVFLGGLSLGYAICGGLSARTSRPLKAYAWLELAIGVWGLAFPWTFLVVDDLARTWSFSRPFGLIAGSLGAALPLVLVPSMLMGATVPFMTRGLVVSLSGLTATHARVYGLNTLGAVAGTLGAGFVLLPAWGPNATVRLAAVLNIASAAILFLLPGAGAAEPSAAAAQPEPRPATRRLPGWTLSAIALGGTPYVFCLVVAAFVASIAVGSLIVARRRTIPASALFSTCAASGAAWLVLFPTYDTWPWLAHALRFLPGPGGFGFGAYHALTWLILSLVLLFAVAPMGAIIPLAFHERGASIAGAGRTSGRLLGWNALGALAGSLSGGFLLFHLVDLPRVLLVAPILAGVMAWLAAPGAGRAARPVAIALIAITVFAGFRLPGFDPHRLALGTYRMHAVTSFTFAGPRSFHAARMINHNFVHQEDGPMDSVAVLEAPAWELPLPRPLEIYINGKNDSNTLIDQATLRLSAHLPMLLASGTRRALIVGQGTGVTAGELTLWPELQVIDLAEVSPNVVRALPLFAAHTHDVGSDPRLRIHVGDARFYLRRPENTWDVIVSEPSNLWGGGSDLLFTLEFFRSIDARLADGGVLLQWLHLYETDSEVVCSVVATIGKVFPELTAFRATEGDLLIVASRESPKGAEARARERLAAHPAVLSSLSELGIKGFDDLWVRRVRAFPDYVDRARRSCPLHTAIDTRLNYRASRGLFHGTRVSERELVGDGPLAPQ